MPAEVSIMEKRFLSNALLAKFRECLVLEEKSEATVKKYIRDIKNFICFARSGEIGKETVITYKKYLQKKPCGAKCKLNACGNKLLFHILGMVRAESKAA